MVVPNARSYRLKLTGTPCGSKVYTGTRTSKGVKHTVTVTDHRTRTCKDIVPARIVISEDGVAKYSYDAAPAPTGSTWLVTAPKQCGGNPWAGAKPAARRAKAAQMATRRRRIGRPGGRACPSAAPVCAERTEDGSRAGSIGRNCGGLKAGRLHPYGGC